MQLRAAHGLRAGDVARLTLAAPPLIHQLVGRPIKPGMDVTYARLCFQYVGALALLNGGVDVVDFSPERLADRRVHDLARRIELAADGNPDSNALAPQAVTAHLKDGRILRVAVPHTLGSPDRPLSRGAAPPQIPPAAGPAAPGPLPTRRPSGSSTWSMGWTRWATATRLLPSPDRPSHKRGGKPS